MTVLRVIHRRLPMDQTESGAMRQDVRLAPEESLFSLWVDSVPSDGREFVHVLTTVEMSPDGDSGDTEDE